MSATGLHHVTAISGPDLCNGDRIDDRQPCGLRFCPAGAACHRMSLRA